MIIQDVPMFKPDDDIDFQIFSPPPRDDRDDFKIKEDEEDLIIYKLPTLTTVNTISKEQLKNALNNVFDDLETIDYTKHTNIDDLAGDLKLKEKQEKIEEIKQFMKRLDAKTKEIEKNLNENNWLKKLFDDQFIDLKIRERLKRKRILTRLLSKG